MAPGVLALLGSGETAPGMTRVHRTLLARHEDVRALALDTPYAFQENVPQMTQKLVDYFDRSLHVTLTPMHFARYDEATALERAVVKQRTREATYLFAGPGSPSYALAQWRPLGLVEDFTDALRAGATLCFSSAAAATLGSHAAPIYEIYKVGVEPHWLEGLNLTAALGLECAIIPHWDNHEGATYDTSRCYLGERRLSFLESQLPATTSILGIDEHTALVIDLETDTLTVTGRGHGHWRHHGAVTVLENNCTTPLSLLRTKPVTLPGPELSARINAAPETSLGERAARGGPDGLDALAQLLELAQGATSAGLDARMLVPPLLTLRERARRDGLYEFADSLRNILIRAGVEVQDEPDGPTWILRRR
ncbi:MAG: Type 1 glutamine amidotransferase-like domain-containing protein [Acidimicrobiales bacterium]